MVMNVDLSAQNAFIHTERFCAVHFYGRYWDHPEPPQSSDRQVMLKHSSGTFKMRKIHKLGPAFLNLYFSHLVQHE